MRIVQMGQKDIRDGNVLPAEEAFKRVREGSIV
ncbi:hypothetical protein EV667_3548 [Ancylobacter aquaticus]|uniref:Uncharacterized protein n=1 Tax=Ancylobacter aquaticus TaxID=100 RepID=A0A4R1HMI2_ANCAQ|nr:hypothetical protein EV667_3548 [Ancylobacter aquaticus]